MERICTKKMEHNSALLKWWPSTRKWEERTKDTSSTTFCVQSSHWKWTNPSSPWDKSKLLKPGGSLGFKTYQCSNQQIQKDIQSMETIFKWKHTLAIRTSPFRVSGTTLFPSRNILPARNSSIISCQWIFIQWKMKLKTNNTNTH